LDDTIQEWYAEIGDGTGFKFGGLDPEAMLGAIDRALEAFQDKDGWTQLMRNGMAKHYGWDGPAKEYAEVYEEVGRRRG
jgi:starch synthase